MFVDVSHAARTVSTSFSLFSAAAVLLSNGAAASDYSRASEFMSTGLSCICVACGFIVLKVTVVLVSNAVVDQSLRLAAYIYPEWQ